MRYTANQLAVGGIILRIGDMVYAPLPISNARIRTLTEWVPRQGWFKQLVKEKRLGASAKLLPDIALEHDYLRTRGEGTTEPEWLAHLPKDIQGHFRWRWMLGDGFDPLAIIPGCPNLGFSYAVEADGVIHDVCAALGVFRLEGIRQLGFLHDPVVREAVGAQAISMPFDHTRYCHSLDVMAVATLIGTNVGLSKRELLHLRVAAVTHDVLTPAGGDSIKVIDPKAFDEDAHYPEAFTRAQAAAERDAARYPTLNTIEYGWNRIREKHGLDEQLLASIVRGEGVLGRLLDVADKCAYVARDVDMYTMRFHPSSYREFAPPASLVEIWSIAEAGMYPCSIWDDVRLKGDQVYFTDEQRLARFLKLRMLMFKHLYYKAEARYKEQLVATAVADLLYSTGALTRDALLTMDDRQLELLIEKVAEHPNLHWLMSAAAEAPNVEQFATLEQAKAREAGLIKEAEHLGEGPLLTMVDPFYATIGTGVRKFFVKKGPRILPFADAFPGEAAEITGIAEDQTPIRLYWLPMDEARISPKLQESLRLRRQQRLAKP